MKKSGVWLVVALVILTGSTALAQDGSGDVYIDEDGTFGFLYPRGWEYKFDMLYGAVLTHNGEALALVYLPETVGDWNKGTTDPVTLLKALAPDYDRTANDVKTLDGYAYLLFDDNSKERRYTGLALAVKLSDGRVGLMDGMAPADNFDVYLESLLLVAYSMDVLPPGGTPHNVDPNDLRATVAIMQGGNPPPPLDPDPGPDQTENSDGESGETLSQYNADWQTAVAELESRGLIASGGSLVFALDYAWVAGQTAPQMLASEKPFTDVVLAGELTYTTDPAAQDEICGLGARVDDRGFAGAGLSKDGTVHAFNVTAGEEVNTSGPPLDVGQPHHVLMILQGGTMTVFVDGQLALENVPVDEHTGAYMVIVMSDSNDARCEVRNVWAYQLS